MLQFDGIMASVYIPTVRQQSMGGGKNESIADNKCENNSQIKCE